MSTKKSRFRLLTPAQWTLFRVLLVLGIAILANSLYLFGYTIWQDLAEARAQTVHAYQWMLVTHFVGGTLLLALAVVFSVLHFRRVRRHKNKFAIGSGGVIFLSCLVLLATGFFLMNLGNSEQNRWVFHAHRIAGLLGIGIYLAHRFSSANPPTTGERWRLATATVFLAAIMGGVHLQEASSLEERPGIQVQAFEPLDITTDPFIPFEPVADVSEESLFFPSASTIASGGKLDPSVLRPGAQADLEVLKAEYREKGFTSSQSIGAEDCRLCHQDIVKQWEGSAHRFSSFNNPFYTASVIGLREMEGGVAASNFCGGCHDPGVMLAGDFSEEIHRDTIAAQAGLTCTTCHQINRIHNITGNGNYELADNGEDPYLFPEATEGWRLELRKYLIRARPRDHIDYFQRPFYRDSEYCSTCHKVNLDLPVNGYKWLRGQDEYDNWHDSGVSRNAARTFYLPPNERKCQDCHMPSVPAPLGDLAAKDGMVRSHLFPAANTALPYVRGDQETLDQVEAFLQGGKLKVTLFAMEHPREGFLIDPSANPPELLPGDEIVLYVQVRNLGVGHTFPGGTNDSNQGWIQFWVEDDAGEKHFENGLIDEEGYLQEDSHQYKAIILKEDAKPAMERDAHNFHVNGLVRVIPPGNVDIARYRVVVPDTGSLRVHADLNWRKFNRFYTLFSYDILGLEPPVLPVTRIHGDVLELQVGGEEPEVASEPSGWMDYNDLGIGLLRQGDSKGSLTAFAKVVELAPDRVDGYRNQARVHILQGDPEPARALLEACEDRAPGDAQTKLWWAEYLKLEGELEAAAGMYVDVLKAFPKDRDTWRRLADVAFKNGDYEESLAASLEVLRIDPEDVRAHYQRMLIYRATGQTEKEGHARAAFEKYRIDDNAPQIIKDWRLSDPLANKQIDPRHVH